MLAFATAFGRVLSLTRATKVIEDFIVGNFTTSWSVLSVLVILFLILGMVMDTGPAIVILAPILLPAVQAWAWTPSTLASSWCAVCPSAWPRLPSAWTCSWPETWRRSRLWLSPSARSPSSSLSLLALALITYVEPVSLALLGR